MKRKHKLGKFDLVILSDGTYKGDGGNFFGVVPKVLWKDKIKPDEENLIPVALSSLLVRTPDRNILIDTGVGSKFEGNKLKKIWHIDKSSTVAHSLAMEGLGPESIDFVILTHLHFDHAGGNTAIVNGKLEPAFRNATYLAQREEWGAAKYPGPLGRNSYFADNLSPLEDAGRIKLLEGDTEIVPGIRVVLTGGHTRGHQIVLIESDGEKAVMAGDLAPTASHTRPVWNTAYDIDPVTTCVMKERYLGQARDEGAIVVFCHDVTTGMGRIGEKWEVDEI